MSSGIARRRASKAARRKKLLSERRKLAPAGTTSSLGGQMRGLAAAPLHSCLVQDGLFERGNGMVILTRKTGIGRLAVAGFLLDAYCLGVKDVVFRQADVSEIDAFVAALGEGAPLAPADPSYARKLLRDLVAYARSLGFEPHADYAALELLFGDISPDACDIGFRFGREGKPFYMPGPSETPAQIRRRIEHLRRRLGDDGFHFLVASDGEDDLSRLLPGE